MKKVLELGLMLRLSMIYFYKNLVKNPQGCSPADRIARFIKQLFQML